MPPTKSKVRIYKENEVDLVLLASKCLEILGKTPFQWQLDAAKAILCGKDLILDVGTGNGKSLCFVLPLLLNETDISLSVSPLSALMLNQVQNSRLTSVAVCRETVAIHGKDKLYEDIVKRLFRHVIVSPEIAVSPEFHQAVLSKPLFTSYLRANNIDEAHCITIWGGTFRPEYANLGILCGKLPRNVPWVAASATLPEHILNNVRSTLGLAKDAVKIQVTNARPNVALSVRVMQHSDESKADLRFIIPPGATCARDIPVMLVYCSARNVTEICTDRTRDWAIEQGIDPRCIGYYHAYIGEKKKRELEGILEKDELRILYCTTALGMGCDFRNIIRVVSWGLPSSFCGFVQESGRAGRDLNIDGESILIVPKSIMKEKIPDDNDMISEGLVPEAEDDVVAVTALDGEGIRVGEVEEVEEVNDTVGGTRTKVKRYGKDTNITEIRGLLQYVQTNLCRQLVWDQFFQNSKKLPLIFGVTSSYKPRPGIRCCDNCQPELFPIPRVTSAKVIKGLKTGKRKKMEEAESSYIQTKLEIWRDFTLMDTLYPGVACFGSSAVLGDDIIQKIVTCGKRIRTYSELQQYVRWRVGHDKTTGGPNRFGNLLMSRLAEIYKVLDDTDARNKRVREEEEAEEAEKERNERAWINTLVELENETPGGDMAVTWVDEELRFELPLTG